MAEDPFSNYQDAPVAHPAAKPPTADPFANYQDAVPAPTGENYDFSPMAAKVNTNLQTHAEASPVSSITDALEAGWQSSISGLLVRGKAPDKAVAADAGFGAKLAGAATGMAGDLPANVAGFLIGAPSGAAEGAVAGPAGAGLAGAATGMAASFALPAVLRATLMDAYQKGDFQNFGDFWQRAWPIMLDTAKNWATGAVTAPAGALAGAALPTAVSPVLRAATRTAAEVATMTTVGKGLEGQLPDAQDFAVTGLLLGGIHGASAVSAKTRSMFAKTGITPDAVTGDAGANPTIHHDMLSSNRTVPEAYAKAAVDPLLAALQDSVHQQESGGAATAKTSVTGARGGMQIQPATFAEYARPGESIDNPMDNLAVGRRIIKDLYQRSGGDPEKVAVGYFSGKGNIAPEGSMTPWRHDSADPTGKRTSSYVADVMRRLNGLPPTPRGARPLPEGVPEQRFIAMPSAEPPEFADPAPVYTDVFDRLTAAGKPEAEADTTARLWQSHVDSVAESTGLRPDMIYQDIRPKEVTGAPPPPSPQEPARALRPAVGTTEQGGGAPGEGIAGTPPQALAEATQRASAGGLTEGGGVPPETMTRLAEQAKVGAQPLAPDAAAKRPAEDVAGGRAPAESMAPPGAPPQAAAGGGGGTRPPTEPPIGGAPPPPGERPPGAPHPAPHLDIATADKAIASKINVGGRARRNYSWNQFYTDVKDRLHPIKVATKAATEGRDITADQDPYRLGRLYSGVAGKAEHALEYATTDFATGRNNGESLGAIIRPLGRELNKFRNYLAAKRAIELEGRGIQSGFDINAARMVVDNGRAKYESYAQRVVDYQDRIAAYLRDSGVISKEEYNGMRAANKAYVPFFRVIDDTEIGGIGKGLRPFDPIKEIKGSARDIVDPLESMVNNTYKLIAIADRNRIGKALVDIAKDHPDILQEVPTNVFSKDQLSVFYNGERHSYSVDKALSDAFSGLNEETANAIVKMMALPAKSLRMGAVLSPDFIARNPVRDFVTAFINTKGMIFSPLDTIGGFMHAVRKDGIYQEWLKSGGANAAMIGLDRRYMQESLEKLTAQTGLMTRSWNVIRHPLDTVALNLRLASELTENMTRIAEFKKAMKGRDFTDRGAVAEAAYASREVTLDFARIGAKMKAANMIVAFMNAQIEGVDRAVRELRARPGNFALKVGIGITLPSIALWFANHEDERYKGLPQWEKDMFWIIPASDGIHRIPKPFEIGVVFGSLPERILSSLYDHNPKAFKGIGESILTALMPGLIPTFGVPIEEQFANRSTFTGQPIIPAALEKQLPEYQYTEYTTETAKVLGRIFGAFPGMQNAAIDPGNSFGGIARALTSPILLENYIRAWTGGLGMYALRASDSGLKAVGAVPDIPKATWTWADVPVAKAFFARYPSMSDQRIQDFYDEYGKRKTYYDTWQAQAKEGNIAAMKRIQDAGGQSMFVRLDGIHKAIGDINHIIKNTNKDPRMTPEAKRQLIDSMYFRAIDFAKIGNKIYDNTPMN